MGKHVPLGPPVPTAPAVRAHRRTLDMSLDVLKAGAASVALASAMGEAGAQEALSALYLKIRVAEFETECSHAACELAAVHDNAAEGAWRVALQTMDPAEIIAGIGADSCCRRCTPGAPGGCVITSGDPYAGATCGHPIRERDRVFSRDAEGVRQFLYRNSPRALAVFDAACQKLKVGRIHA
jgi:hypothetical protein